MPCVVFLQKKAHKAGAQTCLARLLRHKRIQSLNPLLVTSQSGWLTRECDHIGIQYIIHPFPSSRSLTGRLLTNRLFVTKLKKRFETLGLSPSIVHGNDHSEGLLTYRLAKALQAKSALFLRSAGMSRRDYVKYHCPKCDLLVAVGDEMYHRLREWEPENDNPNHVLIYDALYPGEFLPPKPKPPSFPQRWLVIGTPQEEKGWTDLLEALYLLQQEGILPGLKLDFTGERSESARFDLQREKLPEIQMHFLGRVEEFQSLVRQYDLVINPSRQESFGMAALEVLASGVPLLSSRTGVIEQVQDRDCWLFTPHDPVDLARTLSYVIRQWHRLDMNLAHCQETIQQKFPMEQSVEKLLAAYRRIWHVQKEGCSAGR